MITDELRDAIEMAARLTARMNERLDVRTILACALEDVDGLTRQHVPRLAALPGFRDSVCARQLIVRWLEAYEVATAVRA